MRIGFSLDFTIERSRPEPPEPPVTSGSDGHFDLAEPLYTERPAVQLRDGEWGPIAQDTRRFRTGFAPNPH